MTVPRAADPARRRAWQRGRIAETICVWHLRLRGYRILARGYRVPVGEIDIVARRGRVVAAIEVKARDSMAAAGEAIGPRQRRRVARAFEQFLAAHPQHGGLTLRLRRHAGRQRPSAAPRQQRLARRRMRAADDGNATSECLADVTRCHKIG